MLKGHFVASDKRQLFVSQFGESQTTSILFLPSFAEEMNLSRAVVAKTASHLVEQGYCVYAMDYSGTGDSEGELDEVDAHIWLQDILAVGSWLQEQGVERIILWGARLGALLALHHQQALVDALPIAGQLHWKPVTNGKQFVGQFLRIKQAAGLTQGDGGQKTNWRDVIRNGEFTEVAGYSITDAMLTSIEEMRLDPENGPKVPTSWIEIGGDTLTPAAQRFEQGWAADEFELLPFNASAFWQIPEIFHLPELSVFSGESLKRVMEA